MTNDELIEAVAKWIYDLEPRFTKSWEKLNVNVCGSNKQYVDGIREQARELLNLIQPRFDEIKEQADDVLSVLSKHSAPISYQRVKNIHNLCNLGHEPKPESDMRELFRTELCHHHSIREKMGLRERFDKTLDAMMAIVKNQNKEDK